MIGNAPYDGEWHKFADLPIGPATTERIRKFYDYLPEEQIENGEYRYNESPQGFGWVRRDVSEGLKGAAQ